jgi:hypothetical protein
VIMDAGNDKGTVGHRNIIIQGNRLDHPSDQVVNPFASFQRLPIKYRGEGSGLYER